MRIEIDLQDAFGFLLFPFLFRLRDLAGHDRRRMYLLHELRSSWDRNGDWCGCGIGIGIGIGREIEIMILFVFDTRHAVLTVHSYRRFSLMTTFRRLYKYNPIAISMCCCGGLEDLFVVFIIALGTRHGDGEVNGEGNLPCCVFDLM